MRLCPPLLRLLPAAALIVTFALAACAGDEEERTEARVAVVTTLTVLEDIVREVGGDRVEVISLLQTDADPHTYEPTPRDVQRVTEADVIFANGLELESAALKIIEPNLPAGVPLIELGEGAAAAGVTLRRSDNDETVDPHVWLNADNVREYARIIRDALAEADPAASERYEENYQSYLDRLDELDEYVQAKVSPVPPERRKLVTTHEAFGYMADYMGLEVAAAVTASPGQEPSAADIAALQEAIQKLGVAAVFQEPQLGAESSVLQQAAADVGVEVCTLYSGALNEDVPTYIDLMRFNADEVASCLIE